MDFIIESLAYIQAGRMLNVPYIIDSIFWCYGV